MTDDPNFINDPDRQIASSIDKIGERYSASHKRSRTENKERSEIRARAKELGIRTDAFQVGVRIVKDLTANERKDFLRDLDLIVKTLGARQAELFPDEALRAAKREAAKGNKTRTQAELDAKTDTDPKSDPAAGGAQIDIEEAIAAANVAETASGEPIDVGAGTYHSEPKGQGETLEQREAAEGEAALASAAPSIASNKPKSQTAKAQAKRDAAQLPN